jgi:hypothetical protein
MSPVPHLLLGNFSPSSFGDENFDMLRGDTNRSARAYLKLPESFAFHT